MIYVVQNHEKFQVKTSEIQKITGIPYRPGVEFINFKILRKIGKKTKGSKMDCQHAWLSAYFREEVMGLKCPDISLRWIDDNMGWGIFAERDFETLEFIAEYSGIVRKRVKRDCKNAYCFEYPIISGKSSPYIIDAQESGGISRYINHSDQPNLTSLSVHAEGFNHIILYTLKKILKGSQLCYDYGPGYWQSRPKPQQIFN